MDAFDYLSVLLSIVLGLGLTQLLTALGRLIRGRARVRFDWPPLLAAAMLFLAFVQLWWTSFGLRTRTSWSFLGFFTVLLQAVLLYMAAALVLPESVTEPSDEGPGEPASAGVADLRRHYERQAPWLYGCLAAVVLASVLKELVLEGRLPLGLNLAFHAVILVMFVLASVVRRRRFHELLAAANAIAVTGYIALLFSELR